ETVVRIGSLTKTFTALAVLQLVETGRLDLDRDVNEYLDFEVPSGPDRTPLTLRRLLSHQTGFEDRRGRIAAADGPRRPLNVFAPRHMPPRMRLPAGVVAYSNHNAVLAAAVLEQVSG